MAEGDVEIPKVGKLPKKVLIPLALGLAGFVAWRFYSAPKTSDGDPTTIEDGPFGAVDSAIPGVLGAVSPTNSYGYGDPVTTDADATQIKTNAQWSNYARAQLLSSFEDSDIVTALGNYLGSQPLSTEQQRIVRAAVAVAGYPPVGTHAIIPGGDTGLTVAPTGVQVLNITPSGAQVAFGPVSGAASYRVYRNGSQVATGSGSPISITGLSGGEAYTVSVAAVTAAGTPGPQSAAVSFKTPAAAVGAISGRVTTPERTSVKTSFRGASGAVRYSVTLNGQHWNDVTGSPFTIPGLKPNTRYTIGIRAVGANGSLGPISTTTTRTKK